MLAFASYSCVKALVETPGVNSSLWAKPTRRSYERAGSKESLMCSRMSNATYCVWDH